MQVTDKITGIKIDFEAFRTGALNDFADGKRNAIQSVAYGKSDGLLNVECNGGRWPAGIKARDGKLWFPTMEGVAVVEPAAIQPNTQPPPVVIEDLRIDNQSIAKDFETWRTFLKSIEFKK